MCMRTACFGKSVSFAGASLAESPRPKQQHCLCRFMLTAPALTSETQASVGQDTRTGREKIEAAQAACARRAVAQLTAGESLLVAVARSRFLFGGSLHAPAGMMVPCTRLLLAASWTALACTAGLARPSPCLLHADLKICAQHCFIKGRGDALHGCDLFAHVCVCAANPNLSKEQALFQYKRERYQKLTLLKNSEGESSKSLG